MRVHHLNCGSFCPFGGRWVSGAGGLGPTEIVCHCLLIEAGGELVLVDTGFGTEDAAHPYKRIGIPLNLALRPRLTQEGTAIAQIRALGLDPSDVRHVAVTHLDLDHAGGLPDFPDAEIHVFGAEQRIATNPPLRERVRYKPAHFSHGPKWVTYEGGGDRWLGFESIRVMEGLDAEIALVPLEGHTRGHCAVAVREAGRWLLHCGDAYFHHDEVATPASCPPVLKAYQAATAYDTAARRRNVERLRELAREHGDEVRLLCAHDPHDLRALAQP